MTVIPFKRGGDEPPREEPHIDRDSLVELLGVFIDLSAYIKREHDLYKRVELYGIANRMGAALHPFTQPPKRGRQ